MCIARAWERPAAGTGYSVVVPAPVIRPMSSDSVNHSAPSGPGVKPAGRLDAVRIGYSPTGIIAIQRFPGEAYFEASRHIRSSSIG